MVSKTTKVTMLVSIIIPCFNEERVIQVTYEQVSTILVDRPSLEYEFIFVNDGSSDTTLEILKKLADVDDRVRILALSRNFGHQAAVSAGLRHARGELAVIIDADLQDPPQVIPDMIQQLVSTRSNVVYGVRKRRKGETVFKLVTAKLFYIVLNRLSEIPLPVNTGDFRVIDR